MIVTQLGERRVGRAAERHAGLFEDHVEIEPAAFVILARLYHLAGIQPPFGPWLRSRKRLRADAHALTRERLAHARPIREHEHPARVKEQSFNGHRFSRCFRPAV